MFDKERVRELCDIAYTFGYISGTEDKPMSEEDWIYYFTESLDFTEFENDGKILSAKAFLKMEEESWTGNDIWNLIENIYIKIMEVLK